MARLLGMEKLAFLQTLRGKALLVLAAVALVPTLLLGGLGLVSVRGLGGVARTQARLAVEQELRQRLAGRAQERARATDSLFRGVLAQAVSLSQYVKWYYDNPAHIPAPGYLRGGSDLTQTASGHWVNLPETPVGVFISRRAELTTPVWQEVGLLSFADPLITSIRESTPGADRAWVTSATRIVRIAPNVGLGQPGSAVGPDYDLTEDEPFQRAAPERNPHGLPVWTVPYVDPVSGELMITAAAPVYGGGGGTFRAVAGVEMRLQGVLEAVFAAEPEAERYAMLLDPSAGLIGAPERAYGDLGLPVPAPGPGAAPGRAVVTQLEASRAPGVRELAGALRGSTEPGLVAFASAGGSRLAACAPLPATGWVYCLVAPASELTTAAGAVQGAIGRLEAAYLAGGMLATLAVLGLVVWLANRAAGMMTRPVAQLVEGTRRLSLNLSHRLPPVEPRELGLLAQALNSMAGSLQRSRDEAVRSARMVVEERNRLAREIHDTIAQGLTGIVVHLETTESILGEGADPDALRHLHRARGLARESLREARRSVAGLRPTAVEEQGLAAGLEQLGAGLRADGIGCQVRVGTAAPRLSPAAADALYRICQEGLANVRRHSGATFCEVDLHAEGQEAVLQIRDNGRGFDPGARAGPTEAGGFGLWAMQERAALVGGSLSVESRPGAGTAVTVRVPAGQEEGQDGTGDQGAGGG